MQKDNYHHGNLRKELLRHGLQILGEEGEEKLSLREIAKRCSVSSAAPYAHFKNKDDFLKAMQDFVMDELTDKLEASEKQHAERQTLLIELGLTYIFFFLENPHYSSFLFSQSDQAIAVLWNDTSLDNPAFAVLRRAAEPVFQNLNRSDQEKYNLLLAMWSMVYGLSAIVGMPDVAKRLKADPEAKLRLRGILTAFSGPAPSH